MSLERRYPGKGSRGSHTEQAAESAIGKRTLTEQLANNEAPAAGAGPYTGSTSRPVDAGAAEAQSGAGADAHAIARRGIAGSGGKLPRLDLVQRAFGMHDVSGIRAHVGGDAADATTALGTTAFAFGDDVAFAREPDLFTVAHEAAHVVQQRGGVQLAGGIDARDDAYEQHADQVATAVVKGESAEQLLGEGPRGGEAGGPVVQRNPGRTRIERQQRWDPTIEQPLSAEDAATGEADAAAIRATIRLGFTDDKIRHLRRALGLAVGWRDGHAIDRPFVREVRRYQGEGGSGVLDESTIARIDVGASWSTPLNPNAYRNARPWSNLDEAQLDAIRRDLIPVLGVTEGDLQLSSEQRRRSRYAVVTEQFMRHVVNWQLWHRRAEGALRWGVLTEADLRQIRGESVEPPAADAEPDGATPDAASRTESDPEVERESETDVESAEGSATTDAGTAPADGLGRIRASLRPYLREHQALRDRAAREALGEQWRARVDEAHRQAMLLGVNNERIHRATQAQPWMKARWTDEAIRETLGEELPALPTRGRRALAQSATDETPAPQGSAPALERRSLAQAREHLQESEVVVDRTSDGRMRETPLVRGENGWDGRVLPGGRASGVAPTHEVRERAGDIVQALTDLKTRLDDWARHLSERGAQADFEQLHRAVQAGHFTPPRTLRRPLQLTWPRELDPVQWSTEARARQTANQWRRALAGASPTVAKQITLHTRYQGDSRRENPNAVRCDLNRSGVLVTNNLGNRLPVSETHIDVVFADAMLRFLQDLRGLGVTEMWTSGFLRQPISPDDAHPWGRACDITGFKFGQQMIHLRNGRRAPTYPEPGDPRSSDWFNHEQRVNGQTYAQILQALTARMASYFSRITGPGYDAAHANHWHVELTGGAPREIHAIQDQPTEAED